MEGSGFRVRGSDRMRVRDRRREKKTHAIHVKEFIYWKSGRDLSTGTFLSNPEPVPRKMCRAPEHLFTSLHSEDVWLGTNSGGHFV